MVSFIFLFINNISNSVVYTILFLDSNESLCSNNIDIGELSFSFHEEKSYNCIIENSHTVIHAHGGRAYALGCTPFESGTLIFDFIILLEHVLSSP